MVVSYSSVEMTGNYSLNIQQNIFELTLGTRVKISADDILKYVSCFFLSFDNAYFLEK